MIPHSFLSSRPQDSLVISTRDVIKPLLDIFRKYDMDEDVLLHAVIHAVVNEYQAKDELAFLCATPVEQWLHHPDGYLFGEVQHYADEAVRLGNALHRLGEHLIERSRTYRLYQRGFMPYEYQKRFGSDLVLTRLMVPQLDAPRYKTSDRFEEEDFYHRFEVR
jgi:hypothetical protein